MRGSAAFRTSVTPGGALAGPWVRNPLWNAARSVPSLDLRFADNKSLVDATTGQNLVTFTRASSGTYVDSQGVIRTATTNLLLRSEEFDNASWGKISATVSTNQIQSPSGTLTADEIIEDLSTNNHYVANNTIVSSVSGTVYTYSVYVKAGQRNFCFVLANGTGTLHSVSVNLSTGAATSAIGSPSNITSVSVGNGWYRVSFTYTSGTTGFVGHEVRLSTDGVWANRSYTGNGTGSVYTWGAQLEQSSTVGEYIPTTSTINSAPRFDHNPTTGESLGLLVEEQRTNLLSASEAMDAAPWGLAAATAVANNGVAPDGTTTADKIVSTGGGCFRAGAGVANATAYTYSVFLKHIAGTGVVNTVGFERFGSTPLAGNSSFNLLTGTVVSNGASVQSSSITRYPNNWFRVSVTATSTDVTTTVINYTSISGNEFLIWGAQLEAGAFPTSYIPTTTAAVTRSADVASISGSNFSSWYRQDEGTVFAESAVAQPASGGNQFFFRSSDSSYNNSIALNVQQSGFASISTAVGGVFDGIASSSATLSANTTAKFAGAYAANNLGLSLNGATAVTDATATMPLTLGRADVGSDHAGLNRVKAGTIKRLTYWPQRLSNATLQQITQ